MDLMNLLPSIYEENNNMKKLQGILSFDINNLAKNLNEVVDQGFVATATKLLSRYEKIYGLEVDISKSNEFRRERIKAKIRGRGTTTKEMIKEVASSYSNGEVEVIEDFSNYKFIIKFVGIKGVPANMTDLTLTIEEIKPAHLSFEFQYTYRTYNELKIYTNIQLNSYTHQTLREGVI